MLRFPRRAVARFVALLRSDVAGIRAGFFALLISSGGDLVTGLTLASITHTLTDLAGLFILIPAAIGMRGNIFGALGSRLGTQIHAGTFRVSRRVDTLFGQNIAAAISTSTTSPRRSSPPRETSQRCPASSWPRTSSVSASSRR